MLQAMKDGEFGDCEDHIQEYMKMCRVSFPYCTAFGQEEGMPPKEIIDTATNMAMRDQNNHVSMAGTTSESNSCN